MSSSSLSVLQLVSRQLIGAYRSETKTAIIDGEAWRYLELGNPNGIPVLFLHGFGANKSHWHCVMHEYDSAHYRLIAVDIPGASLERFFSQKKHNLTALARWLDGYLPALGLTTVHLVAHSCMALFAVFYASTRPQQVASLGLISTPELLTQEAYGEGGVLESFLSLLNFQSVDDVMRFNAMLFYESPALPTPILRYKFAKYMENFRKMRQMVYEYVETLPLVIAHTRNIRCPVLSLKGEADFFSPSNHEQEIRQHFPGAHIQTISQAGHAVILEKPGALVAAHVAFLDDIKQ